MKSIAWQLFPELKRFETADERWDAYQTAVRQIGPKGILVFVAVYGLGGLFITVWSDSVLLSIGLGQTIGWAILALPVLAWYLTPIWFLRRSIRNSIRRQLNDAGHPTCLRCGYNLTGNREGRCSECGTACSCASEQGTGDR